MPPRALWGALLLLAHQAAALALARSLASPSPTVVVHSDLRLPEPPYNGSTALAPLGGERRAVTVAPWLALRHMLVLFAIPCSAQPPSPPLRCRRRQRRGAAAAVRVRARDGAAQRLVLRQSGLAHLGV